jgi:hypothetical protein
MPAIALEMSKMDPENPQFDEVAARRVKKEHDNGEHEFHGPAFLNAPQEHKDAMMAKINSCPHCKEENASEGSTEAPMATVTKLPTPSFGKQLFNTVKGLNLAVMHGIGDHEYKDGKNREAGFNKDCPVCNGTFWE